jgi:hypothetical protein
VKRQIVYIGEDRFVFEEIKDKGKCLVPHKPITYTPSTTVKELIETLKLVDPGMCVFNSYGMYPTIEIDVTRCILKPDYEYCYIK